MFGKRKSAKPPGRLDPRSFEVRTLVLAACSLAVILPFRNLVDAVPLIPFLASMTLFVLPGALLTHWFAGRRIPGAVLVPVAFVVSVSVYGFLGVPVLILGTSIEVYLWISGLLLAGFLTVAAWRTIRRRSPDEHEDADQPAGANGPVEVVLWVLFAVSGAVLVFASRLRTPEIYEDIWVYTAWVREFAGADRLARYEPYFGSEIGGFSRAKINGWLLEQAALSRVSGLDPVGLVMDYLTPTLVAMTLLSFYALARVLLKNEAAALFVGSVYALFFWAYLSFGVHTFGGEFIGRAAEDKLVTRFAFLPVALIFAVLFIERRRLRYLGFFALVVWAVVLVHPIGLAIVGLSVACYGLVYLAVNFRERRAWTGTMSLGAVLASVILPPAVLLLAGGSQAAALYSADINSGSPEVLANMVFVRPEWRHIYELGNGLFIMHPYLILNPAIALAYLVGIPFLIPRLKRTAAAPLLLGIMVVTAVLVYVPPVATFFGNEVIIPSQIWRVAWPIPLAALLTLGWLVWSVTVFAAKRLNETGLSGDRTKYLPVLVILLLMVAAAPLAVAGSRVIHGSSSPTPTVLHPEDPVFTWLRDNVREPGVVFAPDAENTVIPAYSDRANVVSLRGGAILNNLDALEERAGENIKVPQRALDVQKFYSNPTLEEGLRILRRYEADYVMVYQGSGYDEQLERLPGFEPVETPSGRYSLFALDLQN